MTKQSKLLAALVLVVATMGCATRKQSLALNQDGTVQTAVRRGRFEFNCPSATGTALSSDFIQPAVQGPSDSCFAAHPGARFVGGER
jgi:hypothetical protein